MEGFRIYRKEALADTYRRVTGELVTNCMALCLKADEEPDMGAHEIRKITKRVRATLRLFRKISGEASYQHGMECFRTISMMLAELRLSRVYMDTFETFVHDKKLPVDRADIRKLTRRFRRRHLRVVAESTKNRHLFKEISNLLLRESDRMENIPVIDCGFDMLAESMRKTYKKGQAEFGIILTTNSPGDLHNLRKTVKCLWNQLILVRPVWPPVTGVMIRNLDMLAEKLGGEHDLDELVLCLNRDAEMKKLAVPQQLGDYINRRRKQLEKNIIPLATRLFTEKPGSLAARLDSYYRVWKGM